jgi:outer membrane protein TolC
MIISGSSTPTFVLLAPLILAGCTVGPDFKAPAPPTVQGYIAEPVPQATASAPVAAGAAQHFIPGEDIAADWWRLFHSESLNTLVTQALAANPNLPAAQAALRQALENVAAQRGSYYPSVSVGLDASRNLTPTAAVSPASASGNPYYSLITPQLNVSFVPDVFGANQRAVESLQAQADNQRFMLVATWLTLTSNVVPAQFRKPPCADRLRRPRTLFASKATC